MRRGVLFRALVFLLGFAALGMAAPLILALVFGEGGMALPFALPLAGVLLLFLPAAFFGRKGPVRGTRLSGGGRDGFLLVFLAWVCSCLLGAVPLYLSGAAPSLTDAVFESVSGFTGTGAAIFTDVESLPRSLIFWRAMTQWLGGMGIVVLTATLLPLLQAESPGPETDKVSPRISSSAKRLWALYLALTLLQTALLAAGGMNWFDAVVHAFSTMSTGGFSSRNAGIAAYNSPWIDWVCTVFMLLAGLNFSLFFLLLRGKFRQVFANSEARAYGGIALVSALLVAAALLSQSSPAGTAIRRAFFQTASVLSTTGFAAADFRLWPPLAQGVLFFLMFVGGCSGSAAGGIKVIRHVVLAKQLGNEMKKIIYPRGVFNIQMNGGPGKKEVIYGVAGFVFLYFACLFAAALLVSTAGLDVFSSLNTALLCLGNIGLGLGDAPAFAAFPPHVKWGLAFTMILGRLELWAAVVFFTRDYWRR
jgi:trk system potassium uptake protein TrkH